MDLRLFFFIFRLRVRLVLYFFFSSRRRHTRFKCDWSSDVCSSDLKRPLYYAQRTVNVASARLCLNEGVPMEDVCHAAGGPPPLGDCLCTLYPQRPKIGRASCRERV